MPVSYKPSRQTGYACFFFRLLLGLGIGPKSATIPIFAAESAPQHIRGTLVMVWQLFTALGIMLGYVMGLAFGGVQGGYGCGDKENLRFCVSAGYITPKLLALYALHRGCLLLRRPFSSRSALRLTVSILKGSELAIDYGESSEWEASLRLHRS